MAFDIVTYALLKAYVDSNSGGGTGGTTNYPDLKNKPKINSIELVGDKTPAELGFSTVSTTGDYNDLINLPIVPTKLSEMNNDMSFITNTVDNLVNYYKKSETYTQTEVNSLINGISTLSVLIVDSLPTTGIQTNVIYLIKQSSVNFYDQYMYISGAWANIGSTEIDLSNYYTKTQTDALLNGKVDKVSGYGLSQVDFTQADKNKLDSTTEYVLPRASVGQLGGIKVDGKTSSTKSDGTLMIMLPDGTDLINDTTAATNKTWSSVKIKEEIKNSSGTSLINDSVINAEKTWSSNKINSELSKTAKIDDTVKSTTSTWSSEKISKDIGKVEDIVNDISIAQKTVNSNLDYCFASISKQSPPGRENIEISSKLNDIIKFTPYVNNNITYNSTTGMYTLKDGKSYSIEASIRLYAPAGKWIYFNIWDNTNSKYLGNDSLSGLETSVAQVSFPTKCIVKPTSDIEICIKINHSTSDVVTTGISYLVIQEVGKDVVIDPVNHVDTTQGIEDIPVGNLIYIIGDTTPKHYLPYDTTEYKITDYPYLAEYIKQEYGYYGYFGGDGINTFCVTNIKAEETLVDVTPTMKSDTSPVPYVATASSYYSPGYMPWKAFDNNINNSYYCTENGTKTGWLKLDFGSGRMQKISHFSLQYDAVFATKTSMVKDFTLYGSNDDITYYKIKEFTNQINWVNSEKRIYSLDKTYKFRYYRLNILDNNGLPGYSVIPELRFLLSSKLEDRYIKYEPTYFMQFSGLIEEKTLWEGNIGTSTTTTVLNSINLSDSFMNYDMLGVYFDCTRVDGSSRPQYREISPSQIKGVIDSNLTNISISFNWGFADTIDYTDIQKTSTYTRLDLRQYQSHLKKIVGLKYKTFQKGGTP